MLYTLVHMIYSVVYLTFTVGEQFLYIILAMFAYSFIARAQATLGNLAVLRIL